MVGELKYFIVRGDSFSAPKKLVMAYNHENAIEIYKEEYSLSTVHLLQVEFICNVCDVLPKDEWGIEDENEF